MGIARELSQGTPLTARNKVKFARFASSSLRTLRDLCHPRSVRYTCSSLDSNFPTQIPCSNVESPLTNCCLLVVCLVCDMGRLKSAVSAYGSISPMYLHPNAEECEVLPSRRMRNFSTVNAACLANHGQITIAGVITTP